MSGGQTISISETKAEALDLQSSAYGVTRAVVHGTSRVAGNLVDYQDFKAVPHTTTQSGGGKGGGVETQTTTYTYTVSLVMAITDHPIIDITAIWRGKTVYRGSTSPSQVGASLLDGELGQAMWAPLATINGGAHALAYSGLACVVAQDYDLGSTAQVENHTFEVVGLHAGDVAGSPDADPANILSDWLTNNRWGVGIAPTWIGDLTQYSNYCRAAGLLLSIALTEQASASERIKALASMTNSKPVMMDEQIHMVPLGDEPLTGNGATYTPDLTPIYDLTPDQFTELRPNRKAPADAYNIVKVEYKSRAQDYNVAVATAKDQASIDQYGARLAPTISGHWIPDAATANLVAQINLKRFRYTLNTYEFQLPWHFSDLVPTNIVTLTDPAEGVDRAPVRIDVIEEDNTGMKLTASEFPHSVASVSSYPLQETDGFKHDYNVSPGSAGTPFFIEPPVELTSTGLEVWIAAAGADSNWGGCHVWASMSGSNFKKLGTIIRGARFGTLATAVAPTDSVFAIQLTDTHTQLLNGSIEDALALNTLCVLRDTATAVPEFFSYTTANLTGAGSYTLGGMVRGVYGTSSSAHAAGAAFARLDDAIVKSEPMQRTAIGKQLHVKLQSFNVYGLGLEDLSAVTDHTYTIRGDMALLETGRVAGVTARIFRQQNDPGLSSRNGDTWQQTNASDEVIATYFKVAGEWSLGTAGPKGDQGIPGVNGANGLTSYFHVAYANSADGASGFNHSSGTYIGTYVDYTAADSADYHAYTWRLFKGADGANGTNGIPGTNGADGSTSYLHIKYSNDGGTTFTASGGEAVGAWIGTLVNFSVADSNTPSDYTWARLQAPIFRQADDPALSVAVQDGAVWQETDTGIEWKRVSGAWYPTVGLGSLTTETLSNNAITESVTITGVHGYSNAG